MCFTPAVSLLTFFIEIFLAGFILYLNPKNRINQVSAAILFFLGAYQFTEFGLCTAGDPFFWGRLGFIFYTTLPALAVHWVFALRKSKKTVWPVHFISGAFIVYALVASNFIKSAECGRYFIQVLHNWLPVFYLPYFLYYTLFIVIPAGMMMKWAIEENNKDKRKMYLWGFIGVISFTFPTFFLLLLLPELNLMFPSVLCQFALLFAIAVVYVVRLSNKAYRD